MEAFLARRWIKIALVDAERFKLGSYKENVKCPYCEGDAYVLFMHGPLKPGENFGYALECIECSKIFHVDEEGELHLH